MEYQDVLSNLCFRGLWKPRHFLTMVKLAMLFFHLPMNLKWKKINHIVNAVLGTSRLENRLLLLRCIFWDIKDKTAKPYPSLYHYWNLAVY